MADQGTYHLWAKKHMETLCCQIGSRPTGSRANQMATAYVGKHLSDCGFDLQMQEFACMDWTSSRSFAKVGDTSFPILASPYSLGCKHNLPLEAADCLQALKKKNVQGRILVLHGSLTRQQLMPKNFPFYNPKEHRNIIGMLEEKKPGAIIALTSKNPEMAGALDPFALFEDGDFNIPSAYISEKKGAGLLKHIGKKAQLAICSKRIASRACNVVGRKNRGDKKIIFCAHVDTKANTQGALDNAAGITVLLVVARMLQTCTGTLAVELAFLNGEDYYAAKGHLLYLKEVKKTKENIWAAFNVDGVGHKAGGTAYALFGFNQSHQKKIKQILDRTNHFREIKPWFQGDHMLFCQENIPAAAFTSQNLDYIMSEIVHTPKDRIDQVDCRKLTSIAGLLKGLCSLNHQRLSKNL